MSPRRLRSRTLDLAVASVCVALFAAPFVASSGAIESSINENTADVDVRIPQIGIISKPQAGSFSGATSGIADGSIEWDLYSTSSAGMKLAVSAGRAPALRDGQNAVDIADLGATPGAWSVASGERRFGFSAVGNIVLARYDGGGKWRGFDGRNSVEVARRAGVIGRTTTTIKLRGEYGAALASNATPSGDVTATAVVNL